MSYLLWILILPLLGSLIVLMIPRWNHDWIRTIAFNTSLLNFLISLMLWIEFNKSTGKFQFIAKLPSILEKYAGMTSDQYGTLNFILGVDGISLLDYHSNFSKGVLHCFFVIRSIDDRCLLRPRFASFLYFF